MIQLLSTWRNRAIRNGSSSVVLQFGPVQLMPSFATAVHQTLFVKLTPYFDLFASQAMQKTSALLRNASQVNYH